MDGLFVGKRAAFGREYVWRFFDADIGFSNDLIPRFVMGRMTSNETAVLEAFFQDEKKTVKK